MATANLSFYRSKAAAPVVVTGAPASHAATESVPLPTPATPAKASSKAAARLHRLREVREQQGVSVRTVARHLHMDAGEVRQQETATSDLKLSDLYRWQTVLDVPISTLLVEDSDPLSPAIAQRAKLVRIMKTVVAMSEDPHSAGVKTFIKNLLDQLVDLMPELKEVGAWPSVGQRRTTEELGRIMEQPISSRMFSSFDPTE